jgi:hypothetical protein
VNFYDMIRELKRLHAVSIPDLLALAPKNDPFNTGSPLDWEQARWFEEIWRTYGFGKGVHLRRIHYRIAVAGDATKHDGKPYENTEGCWEYLNEVSKAARHLKLVDAADFDDRRNPDPVLAEWRRAEYSEPTLLPETPRAFRLPRIDSDLEWKPDWLLEAPDAVGYAQDDYRDRAYILEIWIEKTTTNDILVPLCRRFGVNLITSVGTQSVTNAIRLLERCREFGKPARVFYISDFDPAGNIMPTAVSRHLEFYRPHYAPEADVKLVPLMLTAEQARGLPRIPIKESDLRRAGFEALYGEGAVELDALEALRPGEFERIVRQAVQPYIDENLADRLYEAAQQAREIVTELWAQRLQPLRAKLGKIERRYKRIAAKYSNRQKALDEEFQAELKPLYEELEPLHKELVEEYETFDPLLPKRPEPEPIPPDESEWLFDSRRDYLPQLKFYQRRKHNGNGHG